MKKFLLSIAASLCVCAWSADATSPRVFETGKVFGKGVPLADAPMRAMAATLEDGLLYVGGRDLRVFDTRENPLRPRLVGKLSGVLNPRQIVVQKGIAYISAREAGMWIVDFRNLAAPKILSRYDCLGLGTGIDVAGDVCFLGQTGNGVEFTDVSDPATPRHSRRQKTSESQSVVYHNGYVYSGEWNKGELTVIRADDMKEVAIQKVVKLHGNGDGVWVQGNYLYCATGRNAVNQPGLKPDNYQGNGLEIFDISNPADPRRVSRVELEHGFSKPMDMWIPRACGNLVFSAQTYSGLYVTDVTDKQHPKVLDRWIPRDPKRPSTANRPGFSVTTLAIGNGVVYAVGPDFGVTVLPVREACVEKTEHGALPRNASWRLPYTAPETFHQWQPPAPWRGLAQCVALNGDICYAACGNAGLFVLQVTQEGFRQIGRLPAKDVFGCAVHGGHLYTAEGICGWAVYRLDGPAQFHEVARLEAINGTPQIARDVWVYSDKWAIFSNRRQNHLFDIAELTAPKYILSVQDSPGWDRYMCPDLLGGRWLVCNSPFKHIEWVDLEAQPPQKRKIADVKPLANTSLCAYGDQALVTAILAESQAPTRWGYAVITPGKDGPWTFSTLPSKSARGGIPRYNGKILASAHRNGFISVWDLRSIEKPIALQTFQFTSIIGIPVFHGDRLVVPGGYSGVLLQKAPCLP